MLDRFAQIAPKIMVASSAYNYEGKTHPVAEKALAVASEIPELQRLILLPFGTAETTHPGAVPEED